MITLFPSDVDLSSVDVSGEIGVLSFSLLPYQAMELKNLRWQEFIYVNKTR